MPPTISAGGIGLAPNAAVVGPRGGEEGAIHKTDVGTTHVARAPECGWPLQSSSQVGKHWTWLGAWHRPWTSPSWHRWQPRNASLTPARGIKGVKPSRRSPV